MAKSFLTGFEITTHTYEKVQSIAYGVYIEPYNIGKWACCYSLNADGFKIGGRAYITEDDSTSHIESKRISEKETEQLIALAVSKVWEAKHNDNKIPFFGYQATAGYFEDENSAYYRLRNEYHPVVLESLYQEMKQLTLEKKALHTLANLCLADNNTGNGVLLNVTLVNSSGEIYPLDNDDKVRGQNVIPTQGICYGCVDREALIVLHHLIDGQHIKLDEIVLPGEGHISKIYITSKGYIQAERVRAGEEIKTATGFLICRFIPEIIGKDGIKQIIYDPISEKVKCIIHTVDQIPHNERIDDRIMKEIREASVIVVDLTRYNFNVAFEAGYAFALGKPIIWTMDKNSDDKPNLPFDIQSHNILFYSSDNPDEFKNIFEARMLTALNTVFGAEKN